MWCVFQRMNLRILVTCLTDRINHLFQPIRLYSKKFHDRKLSYMNKITPMVNLKEKTLEEVLVKIQ